MKSTKRKMKKKRINKSFIPPIFPTFLGYRLNINNVNQNLLWPSMEKQS